MDGWSCSYVGHTSFLPKDDSALQSLLELLINHKWEDPLSPFILLYFIAFMPKSIILNAFS